MESTHTSRVLPTGASELPNQLATRIELTFEKFAGQLLSQNYELNLIKGSLNDNTLMDVKNEELYKLDNCTSKRQECLISEKENLQTGTEKYKIDIDQILQEKMVTEQEVKLLEKKMRESDANVIKVHKKLMKELKYLKKYLECYLATDKNDPDVFTLYFFTEKKPSNENWIAKFKLKDGHIELIHTIPELPRKDEIASHLAATRDLKGFMYCVYQNFRFLQS